MLLETGGCRAPHARPSGSSCLERGPEVPWGGALAWSLGIRVQSSSSQLYILNLTLE